MQPILPFWFRLRQGKAEPVADHQVKLTAPNMPEAFIFIRPVDGKWSAALRRSADGPDVDATPPQYDNPADAWYAAFELYRTHMII